MVERLQAPPRADATHWGQGKASGPEPWTLPGTSINPGTHSLPRGPLTPVLLQPGIEPSLLSCPVLPTSLDLFPAGRMEEVPAELEYTDVTSEEPWPGAVLRLFGLHLSGPVGL